MDYGNESITLQQAIDKGLLTVESTGAYQSIRIRRANPNDGTVYTIRFNGPVAVRWISSLAGQERLIAYAERLPKTFTYPLGMMAYLPSLSADPLEANVA